MFGHINNVAYFKYIQAARVNSWEQCELQPLINEKSIGPVLLSTNCRFIKPLKYPGGILIKTSVEFIKNTSYGLFHSIFDFDNYLVAEAHDVIVMFDYQKNEKVQLIDSLREILFEYSVL